MTPLCRKTPCKKTIRTKSIRNFAYAAVLTLSALSFSPSLASAQDEGGSFRLSHEVRWQNAVVPAGEYRFTLQPLGPSMMLRLTRLTGTPASFMLMVNDREEEARASNQSLLVISSKSGVSYVSSMSLPEFEVTLRFAPPAAASKEVALLHTASIASSAR
jgi:hypothetical protein